MADILDGPQRPASPGGFDPDLVRSAELIFHSDTADIAKAATAALNKRLGIDAEDVQATSDWILTRTGYLQAEVDRLRAKSMDTSLYRPLREGAANMAEKLEMRIAKALAAPSPSGRLLTTKAAKSGEQRARQALQAQIAAHREYANRPGLDPAIREYWLAKAERLERG